MTRTYLQDARDAVAEAAEETTNDDAADRLSGLADQLENLAGKEKGPDHGRLARIQTALNEVEDSLTEETKGNEAAEAAIERARQQISEYRSGVEGV